MVYPSRIISNIEGNCHYALFKRENVTQYQISYVDSFYYCITVVSTIGEFTIDFQSHLMTSNQLLLSIFWEDFDCPNEFKII